MQILITGAGSLGQAFIRLLREDHDLTVIDNCEWQVAELTKEFPDVKFIYDDFVNWRFCKDPCELVIHTAASKHLPLGEENIDTFIDNNINKTRELFDEATMGGADILFISTDKAVEPCNLYGYTKAIGEYITKQHDGYIARSGNFLNSSGSVIPVWEKALKEDKPLPVTDLNMKRYVIEVNDAAQQIWNGYLNKEKLIIPECQEVLLAGMISAVLQVHKKPRDYPLELMGIRKGEKMREKLRWEWE